MIIQRIRQDKKKPKFAVLELDNNQDYKVYKFVIKKYGLKKGDLLTDEKLNDLLYWDEFYRAKDIALKYFSYRHRSEYEIQKKLENLQFKQDIIKNVVNNLKCVGLINDSEFAENFTRATLNKRLISKNLMKQKLLEKKIPKDIINTVLEKFYKDLDESSIARKLALKQYRKYKTLKAKSTDKQHYIRLTSFLARRGFTWDIISKTVREILNINSFEES